MKKYVPDNALELFHKYFLNREDVLGSRLNNEYIFPICYSREALESHLKGCEATVVRWDNQENAQGAFQCGTYVPGKGNTTKWVCIDLDGKGHSFPLKDAKEACYLIYREFQKHGLRPYIEKSSGGMGYHVWVFFDTPIDARKVRFTFIKLIPPGINLEGGQEADPFKGRGVEVFPKQTELHGDRGVGNQVWLPWFNGGADDGSIFYNEAFYPYVPNEFNTCTEESLDSLISGLGIVVPEIITSKDDGSSDNVWKEWRAKALKSLDLDSVYGDIFTGKLANGWYEARDPDSPTKDRSPSAGVSDGTHCERGKFHSFISGNNISLFDYLRQRGIVEDSFEAACRYVSDVTGHVLPTVGLVSQVNINRNNFQQITVNNRQFYDILDDGWRALVSSNNPEPYLFIKGGSALVILSKTTKEKPTPDITLVSEPEAYGFLGRTANWVRTGRTGLIASMPPEKIARDMVYCDHEIKENIPQLENVTNIPIFNEYGTLLIKKGYDKVSKTYFCPSEDISNMMTVPTNPTWDEVSRAKALLFDELFVDFPFVSESDKCHTLSALLVPFIRQMINGPCPFHLIEAISPGTGKSKLCNLISIVITGGPAEAQTVSALDEEMRKNITASLIKGKPIILLDNLPEKKVLNSASLASVITMNMWSDRILGESKNVSVKNNSLWLMTGNNPLLSLEIARRCVKIRLDPKMENPWQRKSSSFKHPNIDKWALQNRSELVRSLLVIIGYWVHVKCPRGKDSLGSFEEYSAIVGGILDSIGMGGFLQNMDDLYDDADVDKMDWRNLVKEWWSLYKDEDKKAAELVTLCRRMNLFGDQLGEGQGRVVSNKMVSLLKSSRDKIVGQWQIHINKDGTYKLVRIKEDKEKECAIIEMDTSKLFEE